MRVKPIASLWVYAVKVHQRSDGWTADGMGRAPILPGIYSANCSPELKMLLIYPTTGNAYYHCVFAYCRKEIGSACWIGQA